MNENPMAEERGRARRRARFAAVGVGAVLALLMFVPAGSNGYVATCPDGTNCPRTYFFTLGTLLLREAFGGANNLHRLGIPSALLGAATIALICAGVYRLALGAGDG